MFFSSFVSLSEQASRKEMEKRCLHRPTLGNLQRGGSPTIRYPSVHVYKVRLISKFCNVCLNVQLVLDMDKGKACSSLSLMGWEKRHGTLTCSATQFRGYVLVQLYIFFWLH